MRFAEKDVLELIDKTAFVTGATGGLGLETARVLAAAGAAVILAGRDSTKGAHALERIRKEVPKAQVRFVGLDLASLDSVRDVARSVGDQAVDILINNAGVMAPPARKVTADGFELQIGTNHLGHFALTGTVLPLLTRAAAPRVVTISSGIASLGRINFEDLQSEKAYAPNTAYAQSKLANLLFARALQSHSDQHGWKLLSAVAHPGHARTGLIENGAGRPSGAKAILIKMLQAVLSHDAASGALPGLMAATARDVQKFDYFGPTGLLSQKGPPGRVKLPAKALDDTVAERLWHVSEELTGIRYSL